MKVPLILSLILAASSVMAGSAPQHFPWRSTLTPPAVRQGDIGSVLLNHDFYEVLNNPVSNLRIFDQDDREVPFLLRPKAPAAMTASLVPIGIPVAFDLLRQLDGNRIELIISRNDRDHVPAAIQFESTIQNFEKLVTVSGDTGDGQWIVLAKDEPIYDYTRFADVRRDQVRISPGRYSRYRIEISNITEKKDSPLVGIIRQTRGQTESNEVEATSFLKEPFRINRVIFLESRETLVTGCVETRETLLKPVEAIHDARKQESILIFTTQRQPVSAITLETDDANFSRGVTLEGEVETPQKAWSVITHGQISRLRIGSFNRDHLTLSLPGESRFLRYRLTIRNLDNPPLGPIRLQVRENLYEAIFFPKAAVSYQACMGGEGMDAPRYDVADVLRGVPAGAAQIWTAGPVERNTAFTQGSGKCPLSAKRLLTGALVVMAGILIFFVARFARKVEHDHE